MRITRSMIEAFEHQSPAGIRRIFLAVNFAIWGIFIVAGWLIWSVFT